MPKQLDDLEAVRSVVQTLEPFNSEDRERIMRWAREKLGMSGERTQETVGSVQPSAVPQPTPATVTVVRDIRSFIEEKDPKNDNQLAAVVAYYYQFIAPGDQQKDSITKEDLLEACRRADRRRPKAPAQTLVNAYNSGLFDRTDEQGHYRLNTVGENLVAVVLPEGKAAAGETKKARSSAKTKKKKLGVTKKKRTPKKSK